MLTPRIDTPESAVDPRIRERDEAHVADHEHHPHFLRRASWGAIFAGAIVAVVVQIMITVLGLSFGMATVDPQTDGNAFGSLGTTTGIWAIIAALVALFTGGWISGRLAATRSKFESLLHGIVMWAVVTMIVLWSMTSVIGSVLSTTTSALGTALNTTGQGVSAIMPNNVNLPNVSGRDLRDSAQEFLRSAGVSEQTIDQYLASSRQQLQNAATQAAMNPQQAFAEIQTALVNVAQRGATIAQRNITTQDAARVLAQNTGMTQEQATQAVQNWSQQVAQMEPAEQVRATTQQLQKTAARLGDDVAGAISSAAAWTFVSMLIGMIAAAAGGLLAAPKRGIPA